MNPTKDQMYQWYVVEKKSFRDIMSLIGTKNNRRIPKLLNKYDIPIRRGSEAVKTQWINNETRRKQQGEIFRESNKGKPSRHRLTKQEIQERLNEYDLKLIKREIVDGFTVLTCKCNVCGCEVVTSLQSTYGCGNCATQKRASKQRLSQEYVQQIFDEAELVLLDEYKNNNTPISFICPKHSSEGIQQARLNDVRGRIGCKYCTWDRMKTDDLNETEKARHSWRTKRWRESVYKRDNYTCQCCGDSKGGNLHAHHIKNFAEHTHLRYDIDNGITMCESCHNPSIKGSFHYIYGTRNNNETQLKEYINSKKGIL